MSESDSPPGQALDPEATTNKEVALPPAASKTRRGAGRFTATGKADTVKEAEATNDEHQLKIRLHELDQSAEKARNQHELKKIKLEADIDTRRRNETSEYHFKVWRFFVLLGLAVGLALADMSAYMFSGLPLDRLSPVDGIVRLIIGWLIGQVGMSLPKRPEATPSTSTDE